MPNVTTVSKISLGAVIVLIMVCGYLAMHLLRCKSQLAVCEEENHLDAIAQRKEARNRVLILSEADQQRLISLEKLIDASSPKGEGAKMENSIFSAIQYRGDWIFQGNSTKPLNADGLIVDPVALIALIQDKAKLQEVMTAKKYSYKRQLQRYFGEYEGNVVANLKLNADR